MSEMTTLVVLIFLMYRYYFHSYTSYNLLQICEDFLTMIHLIMQVHSADSRYLEDFRDILWDRITHLVGIKDYGSDFFDDMRAGFQISLSASYDAVFDFLNFLGWIVLLDVLNCVYAPFLQIQIRRLPKPVIAMVSCPVAF